VVTVKPALVYMHIPKTAGTSIRATLSELLDDHKILYLYQTPWATDPREVEQLDREVVAGLELVFGHVGYGIHEALRPRETVYATLVRDAVEHVLSNYYHYVRAVEDGDRTEPNKWQQAIEEGMTLMEFVVEENRSGIVHFQNRQTWLLAGQPTGMDRGDPAMLEMAIDHIEQRFVAIGTADDPDSLAASIAEAMGWGSVEATPTLNENPKRPKAEGLPAEHVAEIARLNRLDADLHAYVVDRIERGDNVRPLDTLAWT
jgi:hypothetical protein